MGQGAWEEIDVGKAGADYGWNLREGHCVVNSIIDCDPPPAGLTDPIFDYENGAFIAGVVEDQCGAITGAAFVPNGVWSAEFNSTYLYGDYNCGTIFLLRPDGAGGYISRDFVTGLGVGSVVELAFGPDPSGTALYYLTYSHGGQLRRISFDQTSYLAASIVSQSLEPVVVPWRRAFTAHLQ